MYEKLKKIKREKLENLDKELKRLQSSFKLLLPDIQKAILFGSASKENLRLTSDIDIVIIMDTDMEFLERQKFVYQKLKPVLAELLVYTPSEFEKLKETSSFVKQVLKEGKVIYANRTSPRS